MNEKSERILNGFVNVVLIGLPIALVLIFGEKFSLWINLLTIGCVLFVTSVLSGIIGDEYEMPKRILYALIGASIAMCLKVLIYPGHTTIIIMATILIICTADIINRGEILWLEFYNGARLRFLGKFIFLITTLFIISMLIANFGSQKIWIPIVALSLIIMLVFLDQDYLRDNNINKKLIVIISLSLLILAGVVSTVIQFRRVEVFLGLKLWVLAVICVVVVIIITYIFFDSKLEEREAEKLRLKEESEKEAQELAKKEEEERKVIQKKLEEIQQSDSLDAYSLSFLYETNKDFGLSIIFEQDIKVSSIWDNVAVSNQKNQIIWNHYFNNSLLMLLYAAEKEFDDDNLERILMIVEAIEKNIFSRKDKDVEYTGETSLKERFQKIVSAIKR